jgi:Uma2 family endonuclease
MAVKALVSLEEYLSTPFEHDCEYVHGEIVERPMPNELHSAVQARFIELFAPYRAKHQFFSRPELRHRLAANLVRIPDVAIFAGMRPALLPEDPPVVVIEIVSPDDRYSDLTAKLAEYRSWGVFHVWVADPQVQKLYTFDSYGLRQTSLLEMPEFEISFTAQDIFEF